MCRKRLIGYKVYHWCNMRYRIERELSLPGLANSRYADLSMREMRRGYRVIGGDRGDLHFGGFTLDEGKTVLYKPVLVTSHDLNEDEAYEMAEEILRFSYESIGLETVEHS